MQGIGTAVGIEAEVVGSSVVAFGVDNLLRKDVSNWFRFDVTFSLRV